MPAVVLTKCPAATGLPAAGVRLTSQAVPGGAPFAIVPTVSAVPPTPAVALPPATVAAPPPAPLAIALAPALPQPVQVAPGVPTVGQRHTGETVIDPASFKEGLNLVHKDPDMFVVPNFLTPIETAHLVQLAEESWEPSKVWLGSNTAGQGQMVRANTIRTSSSCVIPFGKTSVVQEIEQRLSKLAGIDVDYLEHLTLVRYMPGEFYKPHHDGNNRPKTVFIYLNELPEGAGGETNFTALQVKFLPRSGCAVMWSNVTSEGAEDSRVSHGGLPPKSGIKYGLNCFFNNKRQRSVQAAANAAASRSTLPQPIPKATKLVLPTAVPRLFAALPYTANGKPNADKTVVTVLPLTPDCCSQAQTVSPVTKRRGLSPVTTARAMSPITKGRTLSPVPMRAGMQSLLRGPLPMVRSVPLVLTN